MDFFLKLVVGLKEILEGAQVTGVKFVDNRNNLGMIEADPAENFSDVSKVFLFDMSVVVFFIRPRASETDFVFFAVADQMSVDKFGAVCRERWKCPRFGRRWGRWETGSAVNLD